MEGLICPHCHKVSYSASPRAFSPCPHCKFRFAISEEGGRKCIVIERELSDMRENYAKEVAGFPEDFDVIVDRRTERKPYDGSERRRVTMPS